MLPAAAWACRMGKTGGGVFTSTGAALEEMGTSRSASRALSITRAAGRCSLSGQAAYASWAQHDARRTTSLLRQISRRGAIEAATPRQFAAVRCQAVLVLAASIPCHVRVEAVPACLLSHWKLA